MASVLGSRIMKERPVTTNTTGTPLKEEEGGWEKRGRGEGGKGRGREEKEVCRREKREGRGRGEEVR